MTIAIALENIAKIVKCKFFSTEPNADIEVLDIPVNAVATALKDFFSKHLPPLFEKDVMKELEEIAGELTLTID